MNQRWVFAVKSLDRPGTLTAAAGVFSNRGVSLETVLGSGLSFAGGDGGRFILSFRTTERKMDMLRRALARLSGVLEVEAYPFSSEQLTAIAYLRLNCPCQEFPFSEVRVEVLEATGLTLLLTGSAIAVEQVVESLRQGEQLEQVTFSILA